MIPAAPRSSARPTRSRSADGGRTIAVIGVVSTAYSRARRSASVAAPCSRSSTIQSKPARPHSSAASGEARSEKTPMSVSPGADAGSKIGHGANDAPAAARTPPASGCDPVRSPLTSPFVLTTSRSRPVMTSSSCMTSSSKRGSLAPGDVPGRPVVGEDHPVALEGDGDDPRLRREAGRVERRLEPDAQAHRRQELEDDDPAWWRAG